MKISAGTMRWTFFWVFTLVYLATAISALFVFLLDAGAFGQQPQKPSSHLSILLYSVIVQSVGGYIALWYNLFGLRSPSDNSQQTNKPDASLNPVPTTLTAEFLGHEISVEKGDIATCHNQATTVIYPTNVYFDTTSENGIVDHEHSSWGAYLKKRVGRQPKRVAKFDVVLHQAFGTANLKPDSDQLKLTKPGHQLPYVPGSTLRVDFAGDDLVLLATARLSDKFRAIFDEAMLDDALAQLWQQVAQMPRVRHICIPIIGAGYGRISQDAALARLLLSIRTALTRGRLCEKISIIVYDRDWDDGTWVQNVLNALLPNQQNNKTQSNE